MAGGPPRAHPRAPRRRKLDGTEACGTSQRPSSSPCPQMCPRGITPSVHALTVPRHRAGQRPWMAHGRVVQHQSWAHAREGTKNRKSRISLYSEILTCHDVARNPWGSAPDPGWRDATVSQSSHTPLPRALPQSCPLCRLPPLCHCPDAQGHIPAIAPHLTCDKPSCPLCPWRAWHIAREAPPSHRAMPHFPRGVWRQDGKRGMPLLPHCTFAHGPQASVPHLPVACIAHLPYCPAVPKHQCDNRATVNNSKERN